MNQNRYLALTFITYASVLVAIPASALSVNDFEKQTAQQRVASYDKVIIESVKEAYNVNNQVGAAVEAYFTKIPPGASETKGYTAFDAELRGALKDAKEHKVDLDKLQIEMIIADVIQTYVLPNMPQNPPPPAPKSP